MKIIRNQKYFITDNLKINYPNLKILQSNSIPSTLSCFFFPTSIFPFKILTIYIISCSNVDAIVI